MNRTHPLFQFMPYGAPELLATEQPRLTRAVIAGCAALMLAFAIAVVLSPRGGVEHQAVPRSITLDDLPSLERLVPPERPRAVAKALPKTSGQGRIEPVVDPPPIEWTDPALDVGTGPIGAEGGDAAAVSPQSIAPGVLVEDLPERGVFVFTDQPAVALVEYKPEYPRFAQDAGVEGLVIVHALVGRDGRVLRVEVDEHRSILLLNETALAAARRWVFQPAIANGNSIPVWVALPFRFVLQ